MKKIKGVNTVVLCTILLSLVVGFANDILWRRGIDIFMGSYGFQLLLSQLIFALPGIIYLIFSEKSVKILRFKKIKFSTVLLCVLLYLCLSPALTFINLFSQLYSGNMISDVMFSVGEEVPFLLGLFLMAILPAFCEECVNRGIYYNTYRVVSPLGGVILSGLIFGLMHGNLNQFTYATVLGMCFALIVEATDSIWSTVTIHFLVNASSAVMIYGLPKLLSYLQLLYDAAVNEGDSQTLDLLTGIVGTSDFSIESVMGTSDAVTNEVILASMASYFVPAVIGSILAFFLYRTIAKRCGRWEHICSIFGKKNEVIEMPEQNTGIRFTKVFTWELIAALTVLVLNMTLTEVLVRLAAK